MTRSQQKADVQKTTLNHCCVGYIEQIYCVIFKECSACSVFKTANLWR